MKRRRLLDSNVFIYAALPQYPAIPAFLEAVPYAYSAVSTVEVLGFHRLDDTSRALFVALFAAGCRAEVSRATCEAAIELRRLRRMTLGDALIAATALEHGWPLVTANVDDFKWIPGIELIEPPLGLTEGA